MKPPHLQRTIRARILTEGEQRLVAEGEKRTAEGDHDADRSEILVCVRVNAQSWCRLPHRSVSNSMTLGLRLARM
jgi:hypothetical protein